MSLTSALTIAQSALFSTSRQTSVVSRNIAEAKNPDYSRRSSIVAHTAPGVQADATARATSNALFRQNLTALSAYQGQSTLMAGMERLGLAVNGIDNATSPATTIGALRDALQLYASTPSNPSLAENTLVTARQVVRTLNGGTQAIQQIREETDAGIAGAVGELNTLLAEFHRNNTAITKGTFAERDVSDELDQRDRLLKQIAEYVPISTFTRASNDMVIMTADGATMFETMPRAVTFGQTQGYGATTVGNPILIDGVRLNPGSGGNTDGAGTLAGMLQLRDSVAPAMQDQLDEIARGLIQAFAESDPSAVSPDLPGLFTWAGAPAFPASGAIHTGLAGQIAVHAAFDATVGGNPQLMRDGGANGAAYVHNVAGAASYSTLLMGYGDRLDQPMAFDPLANGGSNISLNTFSTNVISWFEAQRQKSSRAEETKGALATRTASALSNITGVNIDEELALLLDLEQSYQASARLIQAVDDMLAALMAAVR